MEKENILAALRSVRDPQTGQDIVAAGMVQDLVIDGNNVNFKLEVPSLQMQGKSELNFACIGAIMEAHPTANVNVHFVARATERRQSCPARYQQMSHASRSAKTSPRWTSACALNAASAMG